MPPLQSPAAASAIPPAKPSLFLTALPTSLVPPLTASALVNIMGAQSMSTTQIIQSSLQPTATSPTMLLEMSKPFAGSILSRHSSSHPCTCIWSDRATAAITTPISCLYPAWHARMIFMLKLFEHEQICTQRIIHACCMHTSPGSDECVMVSCTKHIKHWCLLHQSFSSKTISPSILLHAYVKCDEGMLQYNSVQIQRCYYTCLLRTDVVDVCIVSQTSFTRIRLSLLTCLSTNY